MTTDVVPAGIVPPRPAWRSLLWTIPFTVLWTWLIYSLPVLLESGLPALAVRLMVHGLIALGLWLGLERTGLTPGQRRTTWLAIVVPFTLWAAVAWTAAINGVFRTSASPLPLLPFAIFVPVIIGAPLLLLSKRVGQLLDAMPTTWLVALQLYRVFGSQWLAYWLLGLRRRLQSRRDGRPHRRLLPRYPGRPSCARRVAGLHLRDPDHLRAAADDHTHRRILFSGTSSVQGRSGPRRRRSRVLDFSIIADVCLRRALRWRIVAEETSIAFRC
jgi:hypothetical protein